MTPFQEFRLWARRAPANERAFAALAAAVALTLLIWVLIPSGGSGGFKSTFPGTAAGAAPAATTAATATGTTSGITGGTTGGSIAAGTAGGVTAPTGTSGVTTGTTDGGSTSASGGGSTTGSGTGTTTTQGSSGCQSPPASGPGVTDKTIKIAVVLTQIIGPVGNAAFNVADPTLQQNAYQAAINDINASGGVACRKLVPQYFKSNPADAGSLGQQCNDIVAGGYFAVLDSGAFDSTTSAYTCFPQHHIDYLSAYLVEESKRREFYPYVFGFNTYDAVYHDSVFGLKAKGFFEPSHGFKKLGLLYRNCFPEEVTQTKQWLAQVGVPSSAISEYSVGCPAVIAPDSDLQQAVLQFKRDGVTNVTYVQFTGDIAQFTNDAQTQGAHWKYGMPNDQLVTTSYGSRHPNYQQFNGAITVSQDRDGEETTPGSTPTAATKRCDAILAKANIKPTYKQPYAVGNACDQIWMLAAALNHAPAIQTNAVAAGLQAAKTVAFSFPQGPNDFTKAGATSGGQFYRYDTYTTACDCWRVSDATFRRSTY
jgi:hypothetical protein